MSIPSLHLNTERFVELLRKLVAETPRLQNKPPELVPQEDLAGRHVLEALAPYTTENGGVLRVRQVHYTEVRHALLNC